MSAITEQLFECLSDIQTPGNFYATGFIDAFLPNLEVDSVGRIALPLLQEQAGQLIAAAERAPYGKGQETLIDTEVRRTWQIDAGQIKLSGKHWRAQLDAIVAQAATGLGVAGEVRAELYKLLVYDTGSFFIGHRDTEKTAGMFATLVIVLPSLYRGGELRISHRQEEVTLDLYREDPSEIAFAAFYADCRHEVLPVSEGCRLTLIYNLVWPDTKAPLPQPPDYRRQQAQAASLLHDWVASLAMNVDRERPEKLIYPLKHAYTQAELGFGTLKNVDAALAEVLTEAAGQADCEIYLALVTMEESGSAEPIYTESGWGHYWDDDDFEYEISEVFDHFETVSEWRSTDGSQPQLPVLPFSADEFCPPEAFEQIEACDIEFQEATGNAGASFERTYRSAALVIWPRTGHLAIINQGGAKAALNQLIELCGQWENEGKPHDSDIHRNAHTLAGFMLRDWLPNFFRPQGYGGTTVVRDFLNVLLRLQDSEHIDRLWSIIAERGFYNKEDCPELVRASELLPWDSVVRRLESAIKVGGYKALEAAAALLTAFCRSNPEQAPSLMVAAETLYQALPGDAKRFSQLQPWEIERLGITPEMAADLLESFSAVEPALAEKTLDYMLKWLDCYSIERVLMPTLLRLMDQPLPIVTRLRAVVTSYLQACIADQPVQPTDWRRNSTLTCKCKDCAELSAFLDNPELSKWVLKAPEARRSHAEGIILQNKCDVDCATVRSHRPYSLVCTKNQASYQRHAEQHQKYRETLAQITAD
ncbi:2OG-Fe(II) oxygenase [Nitrosomonas sp. ANs5]|uniref:2OG-Fe(II) oxygenase n=1 Tax=Nitrosomonas sp. ANs5 TaxID=3423941 RepID=UPI003D334835